MERLSTDTAHRLVWEAAGEDKEAGSALLTAGKNGGAEASCLISEEGGCNPPPAIVLHTESDERVVCDLTRTRCSDIQSLILQADESVLVGRSGRSAGEETLNDFSEY